MSNLSLDGLYCNFHRFLCYMLYTVFHSFLWCLGAVWMTTNSCLTKILVTPDLFGLHLDHDQFWLAPARPHPFSPNRGRNGGAEIDRQKIGLRFPLLISGKHTEASGGQDLQLSPRPPDSYDSASFSGRRRRCSASRSHLSIHPRSWGSISSL